MRMSMQETFEHKRRVWAAREKVVRLEHELALAKELLAVEQEDYDMSGRFMREIWGYFKAEIEAIPTTEVREGRSDGADNDHGGVLLGTQGVDEGDDAAPSEAGIRPPTGEPVAPAPSSPSRSTPAKERDA